jgi:3-hydroxymyristoyl/3-hydroxydecanoyl-(acyl carrier protein) dehydratase
MMDGYSHAAPVATSAAIHSEELIENATYVETAEVSSTHPALAGHFPGNPVVPGAVVLMYVEDALVRAFAQSVSALLLAKFHTALKPAQGFVIELERKAADKVDFRVSAAGQLIASGKLRTCSVDAER